MARKSKKAQLALPATIRPREKLEVLLRRALRRETKALEAADVAAKANRDAKRQLDQRRAEVAAIALELRERDRLDGRETDWDDEGEG